MSDTRNLKADVGHEPEGLGNRHAAARALAEQAMRAQAAGDDEGADRLFAQASSIDADAVANALEQAPVNVGDGSGPQDDEEIAAMSRAIEPGSDAPSRSGLTGEGSGADAQGT